MLLVSYHFPPDVAVGGLRWEQLARYVVARGWELDVIMRDPGELESRDDARLRQLPDGVRMFGAPTPQSRSAGFTRLAWRIWNRLRPRRPPRTVLTLGREDALRTSGGRAVVRAYFALTYFLQRRLWAVSAARLGRRLTGAGRYAAVITSGPPHMAHEAGRIIAGGAGLPHIMDLRDPWSFVERLPEAIASPVWFAINNRYERRVVRCAALVTMNTDAASRAMRRRYPAAADRIITVRNGAEPGPRPSAGRAERFAIRFAGSIYLDRDPRLVFRAAARVVKELGLTPQQFGIDLIGDVREFGGVALLQVADQEDLTGFVHTGDRLPRDQVAEFLAGGAMLLSLPQDSHLAIPAKIFEYAQFDAWLLILADADSATADLLRGSDADVVDPADVDGIAAVIRRRYLQYCRDERPVAVGGDGRFDRGPQAEILLDRIALIAGMSHREGTARSGW